MGFRGVTHFSLKPNKIFNPVISPHSNKSDSLKIMSDLLRTFAIASQVTAFQPLCDPALCCPFWPHLPPLPPSSSVLFLCKIANVHTLHSFPLSYFIYIYSSASSRMQACRGQGLCFVTAVLQLEQCTTYSKCSINIFEWVLNLGSWFILLRKSFKSRYF